MIKAGALIRSEFNVNPYSLSEEEFVQLLAEVTWLKQREMIVLENTMKKVIVDLFDK